MAIHGESARKYYLQLLITVTITLLLLVLLSGLLDMHWNFIGRHPLNKYSYTYTTDSRTPR